MRPQNTDSCARDICGDFFGGHYVTFDGAASGCSASKDIVRNTQERCRCTGFLIAYDPKKHDKPPGPTPRWNEPGSTLGLDVGRREIAK